MTLESAISGQSFQIQSMETSSVEEGWLDLHSAFFSNTPVAVFPMKCCKNLCFFFSVTYGHIKNLTLLSFT